MKELLQWPRTLCILLFSLSWMTIAKMPELFGAFQQKKSPLPSSQNTLYFSFDVVVDVVVQTKVIRGR